MYCRVLKSMLTDVSEVRHTVYFFQDEAGIRLNGPMSTKFDKSLTSELQKI
jgi:hypothetical protein